MVYLKVNPINAVAIASAYRRYYSVVFPIFNEIKLEMSAHTIFNNNQTKKKIEATLMPPGYEYVPKPINSSTKTEVLRSPLIF